MNEDLPDAPYFDALSRIPLPPLLPLGERMRRQEPLRGIFGSRAFVPRPRSLSADWFFRVACALWARREAKDANELCALLRFVSTRHLSAHLSDQEIARLGLYVASAYACAPRRKTKKGWHRYEVVPFDTGTGVAEFVSELAM
jgi:hypothetical protein